MTFSNIHLKFNDFQFDEHLFQMSLMLFKIFVINKNVIQINLTKFVDEFEKHIVHVLLSIDEIVNEIEKQNVIFVNF